MGSWSRTYFATWEIVSYWEIRFWSIQLCERSFLDTCQYNCLIWWSNFSSTQVNRLCTLFYVPFLSHEQCLDVYLNAIICLLILYAIWKKKINVSCIVYKHFFNIHWSIHTSKQSCCKHFFKDFYKHSSCLSTTWVFLAIKCAPA